MRVDDEGTEVTKAEHIAQVLSGQGTTSLKADARPVLTRLPVWTLADVDAMADMAKKSRNAMVIHLLDVGVEEVRRQMADESLQALNEAFTVKVMAMVNDVSEHMDVEA